MRPLRSVLLVLHFLLTAAGHAATERGAPSLTSGVTRTVLPNGLTLLVRESRHAPVAAIVTWVKAGYFDEPDRVAGMAHLFEHMFFKGSEKFPGPQAISAAVRSLGGQTNAGTIYDYTAYHIVVPREAMAAAMEIQADAIAHPLFDPAELKREAEVVIEESNRKYDNAPAFAMEKLFALAYTQHRIRRWRIGSDEVLRNIRRDDLLQFFESLYRPENIVVSVVGDVDAATAIETAARTYGAIPRGTIRREPGPVEPPQTELRFDSLAGDIQQGYLTAGFHTPGIQSDTDAALDVLASVLADGRSSRLYRALVRTGLAQTVNANNNTAGDVGTLTIQMRLDARRVVDVEDRLFEEIERLRRWPVSRFELARAKNLVETDLALGLEDALGQAKSLARYEANGSYKDLDPYVRRVRKLTAEEIQRAARRYLTLSNASVLRYLPKNVPIPAPSSAALAERLSHRTARVAPPEPIVEEAVAGDGRRLDSGQRSRKRESAKARKNSASEATSVSRFPDFALSRSQSDSRGPGERQGASEFQSFTLANGARVLIQERHAVPTAAIAIAFAGGKVRETPAQAGITTLMLDCLTKGTRERDAEALDRAIEALGTSVNTTVRDDYFALSTSLLSKNVAPVLAILREVLRQPTFPAQEVSRARTLQLAALRRGRDDALNYPVTLLTRALFGDDPYGWPAEGREESVATLNAEHVRAWYQHVVDPAAMWIIVAGDVSAEPLRAALASSFGDWKPVHTVSTAVAEKPPALSLALVGGQPGEIVEQRARRQTAFAIGFPTLPFGTADHPVLDVIQILVSGVSGRFGVELRSRQALAYSTGAAHRPLSRGGYFFGYLAGQYEKETRARSGMLAELTRLTREPVGEAELQQAKSYIAGAMQIRLQGNAANAAELVRNALLAGDPDFTTSYLEQIARVTPADVQRVAAAAFSQRYALGILRGGEVPVSLTPGR